MLKRALPYAVELEWQPALYDLGKVIQESGYEDFTIQFKWGEAGGAAVAVWRGVAVLVLITPTAVRPANPRPLCRHADTYTGQQEAKGYNAFQVDTCRNCWVRHVRIVDCDNAIYVLESDASTVRCACWCWGAQWQLPV